MAFKMLNDSVGERSGLASPTRFEVPAEKAPSVVETHNPKPDTAIPDVAETDDDVDNRVESPQWFTVGAQSEDEE